MLGGYSRHLTAVKPQAADSDSAAYGRLRACLVEDQRRLWRRNLGRDDRIVSDTGREIRSPFLDAAVLRTVARIPLDALVRQGQPRGAAEKSVLRDVAVTLRLHHCAALPKRAIQFGSRLAKQLNKREAFATGSSTGKIKGSTRL